MTATMPDAALLTRMVEVMQSLPELMKERRRVLGIGTHIAAAQVGIHQQVYWKIESGGTKQPGFRMIIKILRWLGAIVPEFECTCLFFSVEHEMYCLNRGGKP